MTLILNGTTGLSDVDGTAAAPAIRGTDADTGLYFPTANEVAASAGGVAVWNAASTFGFKNRIINGAMVIDQRNAGASVTVNSGANFYGVDRFNCTGEATDGVFTVQRSTTAPSGFTNSLIATVTTADASIGSTQRYLIQQRIEGFNVADLGWGTASAQSVTISFWVRSSVTGTFGGSLRNSAGDRSYPFSYTISAANTFEYKTITVAGDTTGTWLTDNSAGIFLTFSLGAGSSLKGTANTWAASSFWAATGSVDLISTLNATFYITGVQLERGSVATSFDFRSIGQELLLCQRYYEKSYTQTTVPGTATQDGCFMTLRIDSVGAGSEKYKVTKRAAPTITTYNPEAANTTGARNYSTNGNVTTTITGIGDTGFYFVPGSSSVGNGIGIQWVAAIEL